MGDDLQNLIGRTRLARAPMASAAPMSLVPTAPIVEPQDSSTAGTSQIPSVGAIPDATQEEQVLLYVLRLVDRAGGFQPLSPVERALVEGARVTFDRLAKACKALLEKKTADLLLPVADPNQPPTSSDTPVKSRGSAKGNKGQNP